LLLIPLLSFPAHSQGDIYLATTASPTKVDNLRMMIGSNADNIRLVFFSDDPALAEREARRQAVQQGKIYVSPYNDWDVICGQVARWLFVCSVRLFVCLFGCLFVFVVVVYVIY
jgi:hypothetical protein